MDGNPDLSTPRLPPSWHTGLGASPDPEARAFLDRLIAVRGLTQAFQNLPRLPLGTLSVALASVASPEGLPALGLGQTLAELGESTARGGAELLALTGVVMRGRSSSHPFAADAVEDLVDAAADLGLPWRGGAGVGVGGAEAGLRVELVALGTPGEGPPEPWEAQAGDALVPVEVPHEVPEGAIAQVSLEGRPWWDVALELALASGLGLELLEGLEATPAGLAVMRGGASLGAWGRFTPAAELILPAALGPLRLPMAPLEDLPLPRQDWGPIPPAAPLPGFGWEAHLARALGAVPPPRALPEGALELPAQGGAAELVPFPDGERRLAWAMEAGTDWLAGDPHWSAAGAVATLGTRLACVGAAPLGLVVILQGGPEGAARWEAATLGLRQACLALDLPVAEVAWREGEGQLAGVLLALGVVEDAAPPVDLRAPDATALGKVGNRCAGSAFRAPFDSLVRLGAGNGDIHLDEALRLQACVREGVRLGLLHSTLPVGGDGLLAAAARGAMGGGLGCHLFVPTPEDLGGGDGGVLATLGAEGEDALVALAATHGVPWAKVGVTGGAHVTATLSGRTEMAIELNDLAALAGSHQPGR